MTLNDWAPLLFVLTTVFALHQAVRALLALEQRFLSSILYVGYAFILGLAPAFLLADSEQAGRAGLTSLLCVMGIATGHFCGRAVFGGATTMPREFFTASLRIFVAVALGVALLGMFLYAFGSAGSLESYLISGRFAYRLNAAHPVLAIVGQYLMPWVCVPPLLLIRSPVATRRLLGAALGVGTCLFMFYFLKGTRAIPAGLFLGLCVFWVLGQVSRGEVRLISRLQLKRGMVGALLVGFLAVVVVPNMYEARKVLSSGGGSASSLVSHAGVRLNADMFRSEPLNYSLFLGEAIRVFPERKDFLWLAPVRRIIFFPLKSGGVKPEDPNREFARVLGRGENSTTIPPSLPGEGYVSLGGVLGALLWGAIYGVILALVEASLRRRAVALAVLAVGFPSALLVLRGQLYELVMLGGVTLLIATVVTRLIPSAEVGSSSPAATGGLSDGHDSGRNVISND